MRKLSFKKLIPVAAFGSVLIIYLVVAVILLLTPRATRLDTTNGDSAVDPTPSDGAEPESYPGTIITGIPTPEPTGVALTYKDYEKIYDQSFESYGDFLAYFTDSLSDSITHHNLQVDFAGSSLRAEAPADYETCSFALYGLTFSIPPGSECIIFNEIRGDRWAELVFPTKYKDGTNANVILYVSVFESSGELSDQLVPQLTFDGFENIETLETQGLKAIQFVNYGAEGALFKHLEVKISETLILQLWMKIKPFPVQTGERTDIDDYKIPDINEKLFKIINSFVYEN